MAVTLLACYFALQTMLMSIGIPSPVSRKRKQGSAVSFHSEIAHELVRHSTRCQKMACERASRAGGLGGAGGHGGQCVCARVSVGESLCESVHMCVCVPVSVSVCAHA